MKTICLFLTIALVHVTSNAAIRYTNIHESVYSGNLSFDIDLDGDNDFYLDYDYYGNSSYMIRCAKPTSNVAMDPQNNKVKEYSDGTGLGTYFWYSGELIIDNFINKSKNIAIKFNSGSQTYYGWIYVYTYVGYLYVGGYAYEDNPGQSIIMGDTGPTSIIEPIKNLQFGFINSQSHEIAFMDCSEYDEVSIFSMDGKLITQISNPVAFQRYPIEPNNCVLMFLFFRKEQMLSVQRHYVR